MDATIAVAIVGALATICAAVIAARTAVKAEEVKRKTDDNRAAIEGFKDLTAAHNAEIARLNAEIGSLRAENVALQVELRAARGGAT